jgi:uncharacterized membrane protein
MAWEWPVALVRGVLGAASPVDAGTRYYIGLAVLVVIMIGVFIYAYRTWEEINDVEDPDSPADLLESFKQAHAEGELDEHELERVRRLLAEAGAAAGPEGAKTATSRPDNAGGADAKPEA